MLNDGTRDGRLRIYLLSEQSVLMAREPGELVAHIKANFPKDYRILSIFHDKRDMLYEYKIWSETFALVPIGNEIPRYYLTGERVKCGTNS